MKDEEYTRSVLRTESVDFDAIRGRLSDEKLRMLHSSVGLATESGELLDAVKAYIFYGKKIDLVNVAEELGDLMWYIAVACDALGVSLGDIKEKNIAKLKKRYGGEFNEESAIKRNLDAERETLEK